MKKNILMIALFLFCALPLAVFIDIYKYLLKVWVVLSGAYDEVMK